MAHEIPGSTHFSGLSRKLIEYSGRFASIAAHIKEPEFADTLWTSLEERNTHDGFTHVANTVTVYGFNDAGRVRTLEVYVMSLNG